MHHGYGFIRILTDLNRIPHQRCVVSRVYDISARVDRRDNASLHEARVHLPPRSEVAVGLRNGCFGDAPRAIRVAALGRNLPPTYVGKTVVFWTSAQRSHGGSQTTIVRSSARSAGPANPSSTVAAAAPACRPSC